MKVLEVKNNLVKISNENGSKLILGGFVVIEDEKTPYVGQIVSLKADNGMSYAIARLVFTFNEEGIVKNYDGTIPALEAEASLLPPADLLDILPSENPVKLGNLAQQDFMINVDISLLRDNLLICSDSAKNTKTIVMNFAKQLENNAESSVIFDIDGKYKAEKRFVFGENFRMPLNFESINFIYGNDLKDIDAASKAIIQDIFLEVQEYTRTIPDKFIPFETFINVVEQQYKESNIPELAILKNKLLKYKEEKVFAESKYEITSLKEYIKDNYTVILDISKTEPKLQKEIITYVYTVLEEMGAPITTFVKINDDNSDKKLLKTILNETSVYTNLICNHNYKFVYELKEQADNLILFVPETTRHDFASYNTYLTKLNHDEFIVWGRATQRIPLIVELSPLVIKKEEPIKITMDEPLEPVQEEVEISEAIEEPIVEEQLQATEDDNDSNVVTPLPEVKPDFTEDEDTYTDLSDDVERVKTEEEDFSALKEEEPLDEISEEDDFDKELDNDIESSLEGDNSEDKEALTNSFFLEPKLQQASEAVASNNDGFNTVRDASEKLDTVELEPVRDIPQEIRIDNISISSEEQNLEPLETEETYIEKDTNEDFSEKYENSEVVEESSENEDAFTEDEVLTLPDPTIDERINEDLPDVEAMFEELPPDEEVTPYENTLVQEPAALMSDDDELIEQVAREVDQAFIYNKIEEDTLIEDDSLTEDDLNFIGDISLNEEELLESDEEFEPLQNGTNGDGEELPVYAAKTPTTTVRFEPGDHVTHPKYGEGVVERMVKYGDKTLYSITFANTRRLLDPAISEITPL
ncbi:hypothetical protein IKU74_05140 [bacterium]|nr:hypothetical protein [bacterium]